MRFNIQMYYYAHKYSRIYIVKLDISSIDSNLSTTSFQNEKVIDVLRLPDYNRLMNVCIKYLTCFTVNLLSASSLQ